MSTRPLVRRFHGRIAGAGSSSGVRIVIGRWHRSPLGSFSDVMLQQPDGRRILLAPTQTVAAFVSETYTFDEVRIAPVTVTGTGIWRVDAGELRAGLTIGPPTGLGRLLGLVPTVLAARPWWNTAIDPVARRLVPGVSTRGTAGGGRREYYGATGQRTITALSGRWELTDLGILTDVTPPVGFGFSSTPTSPSVTELVTTIVG